MAGFISRIGDIWYKLIGDASSFSLEARIFHSISMGLVLLASVYFPYNIIQGLYVGAFSALALAVFFYFQYYNSRYRGRAHSNTVFALTGIVVFSINHFANAGIDGSTDLIWPCYLLLVLAISPYRQHLLWIAVYLVAFLVVHLVEYSHPELVKYPFDLGKGRVIDRITAFPIPVVTISIIIIFLRRSYDSERAAVEEKAATIQAHNEQIVQQRDQLEHSNAVKNKLLSIVSHDMRAPFAHIQGYLHLLGEVEIDSKERQELEKELLNATDQTIELLSNLLYWSRSQMEGVAVELTKTNLHDTIIKTLEIEQTIAARKHIHLTYELSTDIAVMADANMLQLVVRNLLNNAIKFTNEGGFIDVRCEAHTGICKLTIADNGTGIAPDKQSTLFSMSSGSTYGTNNEKGVGLGLPLCKEFMERQGGQIDFESTPGKGSVFYVSIPLAGAAVANV